MTLSEKNLIAPGGAGRLCDISHLSETKNEMLKKDIKQLATSILRTALESGADLAGFVNAGSMKQAPTHKLLARLPIYEVIDFSESDTTSVRKDESTSNCRIELPAWTETLLIIALAHPEDKPALDYFRSSSSGGSEGNHQLIKINNKVIRWLEENEPMKSKQIPYGIHKGGIGLKDAAVMAGLGVIGKNNMLITPQYGPRVRLRALALEANLPETGSLEFDPCAICDMPCRQACPVKAFDNEVFDPRDYGLSALPAREGVYNRETCALESDKRLPSDRSISQKGSGDSEDIISISCRVCEFACPVGA
jgi:epoxyqueuosine reductase